MIERFLFCFIFPIFPLFLLASFDEKSIVISLSFYRWGICYPWLLSKLSLSLVFRNVIMLCVNLDLSTFVLFGVGSAPWIFRFGYFARFWGRWGLCHYFISSKLFFSTTLSFLSETLMTRILEYTYCPTRAWSQSMLFNLFFFINIE